MDAIPGPTSEKQVLFLTDLHGRLGSSAPGGVDLLVLGGDLTHFGGRQRASELLDALSAEYRASWLCAATVTGPRWRTSCARGHGPDGRSPNLA